MPNWPVSSTWPSHHTRTHQYCPTPTQHTLYNVQIPQPNRWSPSSFPLSQWAHRFWHPRCWGTHQPMHCTVSCLLCRGGCRWLCRRGFLMCGCVSSTGLGLFGSVWISILSHRTAPQSWIRRRGGIGIWWLQSGSSWPRYANTRMVSSSTSNTIQFLTVAQTPPIHHLPMET